jgi:hypothetical protein
MRVGKRANRLLSTADFLTDGAGVLEEPERNGVAPGVIADPVALLLRTSSQLLNFFPTTKKVARMDGRASTSRTSPGSRGPRAKPGQRGRAVLPDSIGLRQTGAEMEAL